MHNIKSVNTLTIMQRAIAVLMLKIILRYYQNIRKEINRVEDNMKHSAIQMDMLLTGLLNIVVSDVTSVLSALDKLI